MNSLSFDKKQLNAVPAGSTILSERAFNLIFSGTLLWGFLLNYLIVTALRLPMLRLLYRSGKNAGALMIGILVGYLVLCFLGGRLLRSETPAVNFVGFNLIALPVGVLLSIALLAYIGRDAVVSRALIMTMSITALMMTLSMVFPAFFQGMGRILGVSLLAVLVVELICMIFFPGMFLVTDYVVAGLMCLYIGFDWARLGSCPRTARNAIGIAGSLYLDIVNLFLRILAILGRKRD